MHTGIIGLGKISSSTCGRWCLQGVSVTGYDLNPQVDDVGSIAELVLALPEPRITWVMVPSSKITPEVIGSVAGILSPGDLVIAGGNSRYTDAEIRAAFLAERHTRFLDVGVSGRIWGLHTGFGLMVDGDEADVQLAMPIFDGLRPDGPRDEGFAHAEPTSAGHYVKMVHNDIEYALMQAWAEGYELLETRNNLVIDVAGSLTSLTSWQRGIVVRSSSLELLVKAPEEVPDLRHINGYVEDSGEGRWAVHDALNRGVGVSTITTAIFARFVLRQETQLP